LRSFLGKLDVDNVSRAIQKPVDSVQSNIMHCRIQFEEFFFYLANSFFKFSIRFQIGAFVVLFRDVNGLISVLIMEGNV
jgi:hypothetical protein